MSVGDSFPRRHSLVSATTRIFSFSARTSNLAAQNSHLRIEQIFHSKPYSQLHLSHAISCSIPSITPQEVRKRNEYETGRPTTLNKKYFGQHQTGCGLSSQQRGHPTRLREYYYMFHILLLQLSMCRRKRVVLRAMTSYSTAAGCTVPQFSSLSCFRQGSPNFTNNDYNL
jgi:hypothetical protein